MYGQLITSLLLLEGPGLHLHCCLQTEVGRKGAELRRYWLAPPPSGQGQSGREKRAMGAQDSRLNWGWKVGGGAKDAFPFSLGHQPLLA